MGNENTTIEVEIFGPFQFNLLLKVTDILYILILINTTVYAGGFMALKIVQAEKKTKKNPRKIKAQ